ncbi:MAG: F0F1 ATP synthase subunit B [Verrucomicrobiales bacterium]
MMEILHSLGFDWPNFIAQVIVFLIVLAILKKYAFGPVTAMLEERRGRIAESEANYEKTKAALASAESEKQVILSKANEDANRFIKEAQEAAALERERRTQEAIAEAAAIIAKARDASKLEHDRILTDLKRDFGRLVIDTTAKVTGKVLTPTDHKKINAESTAQVAQ